MKDVPCSGSNPNEMGPRWAEENIRKKHLQRDDWNDVKMKVMYNTLYYKFTKNELCKEVLKKTQGKLLVENSGNRDSFWGNGTAQNWGILDFKQDTWNLWHKPDIRGYNWLGLLLMQIRDKIFETNFCTQFFGGLPFMPTDNSFSDRYGVFKDTDQSIL